MKRFKYVIVSTRGNEGGPIVLHSLCKLLCEQGENAKMFYTHHRIEYKKPVFLYWLFYTAFFGMDVFLGLMRKILGDERIKKFPPNSVKGCKRKWFPFVGKNTVVIYPEIVYGNPLRAKKVVRWLLYHNKYYKQDGEKTIGYEKDDLFFAFREVFNDSKLNPASRLLFTPYFDLDLYKQTNFGERTGKCYIIRKGATRNDLPLSFDGIVIDDLPEKEKVRVFNECEYCISYDTQTAYSKIASICGCVSIVIPEEGKTRKDYRESEEDSYGVSFGFDESEIERAKNTRHLAKESYERMNAESIVQVDNFIEVCNEYFC